MDTLLVYPNPFAAFDKDGEPCGVCPRDTDADAGGPGRFVGARIDPARTQVLQDFGKNAPHELRSPRQRTKYTFLGIASDDPELAAKLLSKDPIEIPKTKFYRDRIQEGALLPADEKTAAAARLRRYVSPAERLHQYLPAPAPEAAPTVTTGPATVDDTAPPALPESTDATPALSTEPVADFTKPSKSKRQESSS